MEIVYIHSVSVFLYVGLILYSVVKRQKPQATFLLATALTIFWLSQSIFNNIGSDSYYTNYYSSTLSLYGWLLFLQSVYLKIPNSTVIRLLPVYGLNLLLIAIFIVQFRVDRITGSGYIDQETLFFANFIMGIAILFCIENITRCLKPNYRYVHKHLLFALAVLALINLINFYYLFSHDELYPLFHFLSLFIHLVIPLFLFISISRQARFEEEQFEVSDVSQLQYFLILIGSLLVITGVLQMFDLYFSQVRSDFYQAIFLVVLGCGIAVLFLSNEFRNEIASYFKSYFYGDKNDYKREWERVSQITRNEDDIYRKVMDYFKERLNALDSALYIYDQGAMTLKCSTSDHFEPYLKKLNSFLKSKNQISETAFALETELESPVNKLVVTLIVEGDVVGLCLLHVTHDPGLMDTSSLKLIDTVSSEFAIRLWEIRHRQEIYRKNKLATFNQTVAFLAHDLKNIVAQQQLALENFIKFREDPEFLDDFNATIGHSTERLSDLISHFRVSSLNSKRRQITINQLKDALEQKVRLSGQPIDFKFGDSADNQVSIDAEIITVIENLIKNAAEATLSDDPVRVTVSCNGEVSIEVSDQGEGMTQDFIENKLFEPFNSTKKEEGLGVGMFHVKNILETMGADIDVQSKVGLGTTITVRIPV